MSTIHDFEPTVAATPLTGTTPVAWAGRSRSDTGPAEGYDDDSDYSIAYGDEASLEAVGEADAGSRRAKVFVIGAAVAGAVAAVAAVGGVLFGYANSSQPRQVQLVPHSVAPAATQAPPVAPPVVPQAPVPAVGSVGGSNPNADNAEVPVRRATGNAPAAAPAAPPTAVAPPAAVAPPVPVAPPTPVPAAVPADPAVPPAGAPGGSFSIGKDGVQVGTPDGTEVSVGDGGVKVGTANGPDVSVGNGQVKVGQPNGPGFSLGPDGLQITLPGTP